MTGQVKEEVLTRFGELGFHVADGCRGELVAGEIASAGVDALLVVGSLIIAGAILLSQESYWLGGIILGSSAFYALGHSARVWLLGNPEP